MENFIEIKEDAKSWWESLNSNQRFTLMDKYPTDSGVNHIGSIIMMYQKEHPQEEGIAPNLDEMLKEKYKMISGKNTAWGHDNNVIVLRERKAFKAGAAYQKEIDSGIVSELLEALNQIMNEADRNKKVEFFTFDSWCNPIKEAIDKANDYLTDKNI